MLKAPDVEKWLAAVKLKFDTLVKMGCWEVVDISLETPLLGVRWVYKINRIQSVCERHEGRLVVKGYMQEKGIHCDESFFAYYFSSNAAHSHGFDKSQEVCQVFAHGTWMIPQLSF